MTNRRIVALVVVAVEVVVGSGFAIPAAVGASPRVNAGSVACTEFGTKPMGNTGVAKVSLKGSTAGTPIHCSGKLTGKWARNSVTFTTGGSADATLGKGDAVKLAPGANWSPLKGVKLATTLSGGGLPRGSALTVKWRCWLSYPPLKMGCEITISAA